LENPEGKISFHETSISTLEKEIEKENKKLTRVYEFLEDGTYTKEMFFERLKNISETVSKLNASILKHKEEMEREKRCAENKETIIPKIENVLNVYDDLQEIEDKNILLKSILEKATYKKITKAIKKDSDPTDFEITIYPKFDKNWCN